MKFPFNFWGMPAGTVIAKRSVATDPHAAIKVATASTVDWGDGTPLEAATANVQLNHVYTALGEMTVTITADAPHAMNPDLSLKHPASTAVDAGWKEVVIRDPHLTAFTVKPNNSLTRFIMADRNRWTPPGVLAFSGLNGLDFIEFAYLPKHGNVDGLCESVTNLREFSAFSLEPGFLASSWFKLCKNLAVVNCDFSTCTGSFGMFRDAHLRFNPSFDLPESRNIGFMFYGVTGITSANITGTRKATNATATFASSSLSSINRMDMDSITDTQSMFQSTMLVHHPGYIGEMNQNSGNMFNGCAHLETVGDIGMGNITSTTQMFASCPKLRSLTLRGLRVSISINGLKLDATALDAVFTSLGPANAGATINITGNPGAATCNKTIATSKSWGVTG